jgi:hypothetical protein
MRRILLDMGPVAAASVVATVEVQEPARLHDRNQAAALQAGQGVAYSMRQWQHPG